MYLHANNLFNNQKEENSIFKNPLFVFLTVCSFLGFIVLIWYFKFKAKDEAPAIKSASEDADAPEDDSGYDSGDDFEDYSEDDFGPGPGAIDTSSSNSSNGSHTIDTIACASNPADIECYYTVIGIRKSNVGISFYNDRDSENGHQLGNFLNVGLMVNLTADSLQLTSSHPARSDDSQVPEWNTFEFEDMQKEPECLENLYENVDNIPYCWLSLDTGSELRSGWHYWRDFRDANITYLQDYEHDNETYQLYGIPTEAFNIRLKLKENWHAPCYYDTCTVNNNTNLRFIAKKVYDTIPNWDSLTTNGLSDFQNSEESEEPISEIESQLNFYTNNINMVYGEVFQLTLILLDIGIDGVDEDAMEVEQ
tara:strand:- start:862 stop:1956 length:1095 start_codon:yes stop_codon:yes gene_type:complete